VTFYGQVVWGEKLACREEAYLIQPFNVISSSRNAFTMAGLVFYYTIGAVG
jgi:hypothetical protein